MQRSSRLVPPRRSRILTTTYALAAISAVGLWAAGSRPQPLPARYDEVELAVTGLT
jgi:hypothetical protein